ncbi:MAG TPA: UDP-glucuronic acid decarboxylase family protein [Acidimicrobiia bacterium]|nr:UDP-glucuronic acid decarboxylase family protein [Acidimicrobiia bacterium]
MPRAVLTGGAGFLGSHLATELRRGGYDVVAVDDLSTGRVENLDHLADDPGFTLLEHDVSRGIPIDGPVAAVLHFASPASPPAYLARPLETLAVGSEGTRHALELARAHGARFLLASTSEIYGDPLVHPQPESYLGNVNSVGPRAVYDEAKRFAEAITMAYHREYGLDTKIVRIFNTYGPRMAPGDGRVVTNFLEQALAGRPLTVYGDGSQTRSFCWVDDEVRGFLALLASDWTGPMNVGNPGEFTVLELAKIVIEVTASDSEIVFEPLPVDDPTRRRPDITLARDVLGWEPEVDLRTGVARLADWYRTQRMS